MIAREDYERAYTTYDDLVERTAVLFCPTSGLGQKFASARLMRHVRVWGWSSRTGLSVNFLQPHSKVPDTRKALQNPKPPENPFPCLSAHSGGNSQFSGGLYQFHMAKHPLYR